MEFTLVSPSRLGSFVLVLFFAAYIAASAALGRESLVVPSSGYSAVPTLVERRTIKPCRANGSSKQPPSAGNQLRCGW